MNEITVLKIAPMCEPEVVTLKNDLRALQEAVSEDAPYVGLIEVIDIDTKTCILCNEEAKLIGLQPNRRVGEDILCGTFYIIGQDGEGSFTSLSAAGIELYKKVFGKPEIIPDEEAEKTFFIRFCVL